MTLRERLALLGILARFVRDWFRAKLYRALGRPLPRKPPGRVPRWKVEGN